VKPGETRQGQRLYSLKDDWSDLLEGCYYKLPSGEWAIYPPGGNFGTISPKVHSITEHEDGTVTMTPSILYHPWLNGSNGWHGYLERGVWRRIE
jgi:hypothetical protein